MKKDNKIPVFNQYETVSPATKLLEKRRKMYEIHEAFEQQKQKFKDSEVMFRGKEGQIKKKDKDLQSELQKFCQFLQENESKRKKAEQKSKQEQKQYNQKERQLKILEAQIEQLTKNQKKYMNRVSHLRKYEDFLEKVRSTYPDQYPEMQDILSRYTTLKRSNEDLIRQRQRLETQHEQLRKQSLSYEKQMNQSILTINNEIKQLSRRIEEKTHEKNQVQADVERSNEEFSSKNLNLGKIFMAIDNLYFRANQNTYRLKYQFDEKGNLERKEAKTKKDESGKAKNDEQSSYEQRAKHAANKLKNILSHMKDLKVIIDQYRSTYKNAKENNKPDRY